MARKSDTEEELERLRAEVAELRKAKAEADAAGGAEAGTASDGADDAAANDAPNPMDLLPEGTEEALDAMKDHLDEISEVLEENFRERPLVTALLLLVLGLFIGRFLR